MDELRAEVENDLAKALSEIQRLEAYIALLIAEKRAQREYTEVLETLIRENKA